MVRFQFRAVGVVKSGANFATTCRSGRVRPQANAAFWGPKLDRNKERDAKNLAALAADGWTSLVVWACELRDEDALRVRLTAFLGERGP